MQQLFFAALAGYSWWLLATVFRRWPLLRNNTWPNHGYRAFGVGLQYVHRMMCVCVGEGVCSIVYTHWLLLWYCLHLYIYDLTPLMWSGGGAMAHKWEIPLLPKVFHLILQASLQLLSSVYDIMYCIEHTTVHSLSGDWIVRRNTILILNRQTFSYEQSPSPC
jgi:hypothetical protein